MNSKWERKKVSALCELIVDCVNKTAPTASSITPYKMIRTSNIKNGRINLDGCRYVTKETFEKWTRRARVQVGDVLLTREAPMGEIGYVSNEDKVFLGQRIMQYRANLDYLDSRFLLYAFLSPDLQFQFRKYNNGGSTVSHIRVPDCFDFEINTPPLQTQKKIASVLFALDKKIEINNRINAELEQMEKALYHYWFVQFDFPNAQGMPYKTSGGKMVYNDTLKQEIPFQWGVTLFNDWIGETKAGDWGKDMAEGNYTERVYCIRGADINGLSGKAEIKAPERFILKNNLTKALKPNEFIIEISGGSPTQSTGRIALMTEKALKNFNTNVICSNFCKAVSIKDETYVFNFKQEWQRLYETGVFFRHEGKTSGIKNFLFDAFINSYYVTFPDKTVVQKYYKLAKSFEEKRQYNLQQTQELIFLRNWLLPMLMNGQVTVQDNRINNNDDRVTNSAPHLALFNIAPNKKGFAKKVLAGKIVSKFKDDPNFTDIKFQKIQFLAEHIIEADLNLNYYCQAAGPYDNRFMHTIYSDFKKQKWFDYQKKRFVILEKQGKIEGYYQEYFGSAQNQLNNLFELLYHSSESEAEIIATLYAVWNNRIIERKTISDEELIKDFYLWSDRKQRYTEKQALAGLQWLRMNQMEPNGFGKLIKKAKGKS